MTTKRNPMTELPLGDYPAVGEYMAAQDALEGFIRDNQAVYDQLCRLAGERNTRLEEAEKVARATGCSVGPFSKMSETKKINAEKLYEEIGAVNFMKVGGYTETVTAYKVDRERFLSLVRAGQVPGEIVEVVVKDEVRYRVIPKYVLP